MDEMDQYIQLRSQALGFKAILMALCIWNIVNSCRALVQGSKLEMLPTFLLLSLCVQAISQIVIKQKMVSGDEEYKEPNKLVRILIGIIILSALILSIGAYLI